MNFEAEIRDLAARRDITDAVQRYMRGLDRLDPELQRSAFHDDAWIDAGVSAGGPDEFVAFCQEFLGMTGGSHHHMGQVRIVVHPDGRTASGEVYFQAWHAAQDEAGAPRDLFVSGRYVDEYRCDNGDWRIVRRRLINDWVKNDPADLGFYAANPNSIRGGRRGEDFSQKRDWPR